MNLLREDLIGKFAFKIHDGVVGDRATDQASHSNFLLNKGVECGVECGVYVVFVNSFKGKEL
jgi:hypothetical protein